MTDSIRRPDHELPKRFAHWSPFHSPRASPGLCVPHPHTPAPPQGWFLGHPPHGRESELWQTVRERKASLHLQARERWQTLASARPSGKPKERSHHSARCIAGSRGHTSLRIYRKRGQKAPRRYIHRRSEKNRKKYSHSYMKRYSKSPWTGKCKSKPHKASSHTRWNGYFQKR